MEDGQRITIQVENVRAPAIETFSHPQEMVDLSPSDEKIRAAVSSPGPMYPLLEKNLSMKYPRPADLAKKKFLEGLKSISF